jgi:hypothetical protein
MAVIPRDIYNSRGRDGFDSPLSLSRLVETYKFFAGEIKKRHHSKSLLNGVATLIIAQAFELSQPPFENFKVSKESLTLKQEPKGKR